MVRVLAIAAMDEKRVIGFQGKLPWHYPEDMQHFKELTRGDAVLMGRKTYESLPPKSRPLPGRKNIVVTRSPAALGAEPVVEICASPVTFIAACRAGEIKLPSEKLWIIGGAQVYQETLPQWDELFLTVVHSTHQGDAFFPPFEDQFTLAEEEREGALSFQHYIRTRS